MERPEADHFLAGLLSTMYETDQHPERQLKNAAHIISVLQTKGIVLPNILLRMLHQPDPYVVNPMPMFPENDVH